LWPSRIGNGSKESPRGGRPQPPPPGGAPWRAGLSMHDHSTNTVSGLTGAALLKEWKAMQQSAAARAAWWDAQWDPELIPDDLPVLPAGPPALPPAASAGAGSGAAQGESSRNGGAAKGVVIAAKCAQQAAAESGVSQTLPMDGASVIKEDASKDLDAGMTALDGIRIADRSGPVVGGPIGSKAESYEERAPAAPAEPGTAAACRPAAAPLQDTAESETPASARPEAAAAAAVAKGKALARRSAGSAAARSGAAAAVELLVRRSAEQRVVTSQQLHRPSIMSLFPALADGTGGRRHSGDRPPAEPAAHKPKKTLPPMPSGPGAAKPCQSLPHPAKCSAPACGWHGPGYFWLCFACVSQHDIPHLYYYNCCVQA
jgi:hypothetical protein